MCHKYKEKNIPITHKQLGLYHMCLYLNLHLFCEDEYLEQDLPSQAQYGSLARQQSAQTSPYTSQRWRAR